MSETIAPAGVPQLDDAALRRVLRRTKYAHLSEDQFELAMVVCQRRGLDPWLDHVYVVSRPGDKRNEIQVMATLQGLRDLAESTGKYSHQLGPFWCGIDRKWRRGWVEKEPPMLARVGVVKKGSTMAFWGVARWDEALPLVSGKRGEMVPDPAWQKMPSFMLAKVAEAMALRKAFPSKIGGLYTPDEIPPGAAPLRPTETRAVFHGPAVDESTPTSEFLFQMRLVRDFELANPMEREKVVDEFRAKYADLYVSDRRGWYAAVLYDLEQSRRQEGHGSA